MANVSSSNGLEKRPKLRFPGFDEPWNTKQFFDVFSFLPNNTLSRADLLSDGDIKNIHYGDVLIKYSSIIDMECDDVPAIAYGKESNGNPYLCDGDVIIADTAEDETVGKCCEIVNINEKKVESGLHTIPCRPLITFSPMFLGYYMNSPAFHKQLFPLMQGVKVLSISKSNIGKTRISAPTSYSEQKKIADALHLIDLRLRKQQQIIDALKKYKRGLSVSIFDAESRKHEMELGDVCEIVGGGTPDTADSRFWGGNVIWFTPTEVGKTKYVYSSERTLTAAGISNSSAKLLPSGTILLTTRATLGEMSIAKTECSTNQGFQSLIARKGKALPEYIYYLQVIIKPWCEKYASGNTFREISKKALSKCLVPVPSISRQQEIVKILSAIDRRIISCEEALQDIMKLKASLVQQLFI